jgi:hypothetical protein
MELLSNNYEISSSKLFQVSVDYEPVVDRFAVDCG